MEVNDFLKLDYYQDEKIPFVYRRSFSINNDFLKTKKIYYKYQIKRTLDNITKDDEKIINNIYQKYLTNKILDDNDSKKIVRKYFGKSSSISKLLVANYSKVSSFINNKGNLRIFKIYDHLDYYLPLSLSIETRKIFKEKGIIKMTDLLMNEMEINQFDYSNLARYSYDLCKYYLSDEIFYSILNKDERELFNKYLSLDSYLLLSQEIKVSPTEARARIYTIIKKCLKFFDSVDGIRFFDLLFSENNLEITIKDIKKMFPICHNIFLYFIKKGFFKEIELINSLDIIRIKWYNYIYR